MGNNWNKYTQNWCAPFEAEEAYWDSLTASIDDLSVSLAIVGSTYGTDDAIAGAADLRAASWR
jgi:hypothetical protein